MESCDRRGAIGALNQGARAQTLLGDYCRKEMIRLALVGGGLLGWWRRSRQRPIQRNDAMSNPAGAQFEISVDGKPRSSR